VISPTFKATVAEKPLILVDFNVGAYAIFFGLSSWKNHASK
jgi:hypothetical protein